MAGPPVQLNDQSGGIMVLNISRGSKPEHQLRVHIGPFNTTADTTPTMVATGFLGVNNDYPYTDTSGAFEATVAQTFGALAHQLAALYSTDWTISLHRLYRNSHQPPNTGTPGAAGGDLTPVFPLPDPPEVVGTSSGTNNWLAGQVTLSLPTVRGNRFRLVLLSSQEWDPTGQARVVKGAYGVGPMQGLIAYLEGQPYSTLTIGPWAIAGAVSQITGHDGSRLGNAARITNTLNHRVRRSLGYT